MKQLQQIVRDPRASYDQSLLVLKHTKALEEGMVTKSSIMLSLGESNEKLKQTMRST
jgi:lipoic acid synthetase